MKETGRALPMLRAGAAATLVMGVFLLLSSWDGLYDALDLPQGLPALSTQLGGAAFVALAYLQWVAATRRELVGPVAITGAIAQGGAALIVAGWLIFRDPQVDIGIDNLGTGILCGVIVVLALVAAGLVYVARSLRATK